MQAVTPPPVLAESGWKVLITADSTKRLPLRAHIAKLVYIDPSYTPKQYDGSEDTTDVEYQDFIYKLVIQARRLMLNPSTLIICCNNPSRYHIEHVMYTYFRAPPDSL